MRPAIVRLALLGFVARALVPIGFMPAALADGGPIRICGSGPVGAWLEQVAAGAAGGDRPAHATHAAAEHAAHTDDPRALDQRQHANAARAADHGGHTDDARAAEPTDHGPAHDTAHSVWEKCPAGTAFAHAVLPSEIALSLPNAARVFAATEPLARPSLATPRIYEARAPPQA